MFAGSCWAFSTIVGVEGINKIKTNELVSLSEQELVDCETDNHGCDGGLMENALEFIKKNGGVTKESIYPYKAKDIRCDASKVLFNIMKHLIYHTLIHLKVFIFLFFSLDYADEFSCSDD